MSPILVRPVREQLEHDRLIRLLQAKYRRRYEVGINPSAELNAAVGTGPSALYPDLVLYSTERGRRLQALVEVETTESVNHLEALAEWAIMSRQRAAFFLYVPAGMVEVARRLCSDNHVEAAEIWSFHAVGDQMRFTPIHRAEPAKPAPAPRAAAKVAQRARPVRKAARKTAPKAAPARRAQKRR